MVKPSFCLYTAILLVLVPLTWVVAWLTATMFHELCHYAMLKCYNCKVQQVVVSGHGVLMETDAEGISLVISALAGPAGGLLLLLFVRQFPRLAICAAVQSIFNLLPIYPLDGGRVLYGLVTYTLPHRNPERIVKLSGLTFILFISMACFVLTWQYRLIELAIFIAALLVIKSGILKFPCKERWLRVQ